MIPQLVASGTTFGAIFLFMTYIAYIFFGTNLEDWSTFVFSIGSSIGALFRAQAQFFLSFSLLLDNHAVVKMNIYIVVHPETKRVCEVLGLVISFSFFLSGNFLGASDFDDQFLINNYATFFWHYLFIFLIVFMVINMVVAIVVESFEENFKFRSENPYLEDSIIKTAVIFCITSLVPITSRLNVRCDDFCCCCLRAEFLDV